LVRPENKKIVKVNILWVQIFCLSPKCIFFTSPLCIEVGVVVSSMGVAMNKSVLLRPELQSEVIINPLNIVKDTVVEILNSDGFTSEEKEDVFCRVLSRAVSMIDTEDINKVTAQR
jgi:hypothetical protein